VFFIRRSKSSSFSRSADGGFLRWAFSACLLAISAAPIRSEYSAAAY